jgi:hypothetical protein
MKRELSNPCRHITATALATHDIFFMLSNPKAKHVISVGERMAKVYSKPHRNA